jgi:nitrate reductase gamma subunit
VTLSPYLRSLVEFRPDPELVVTLPYTVRLHVLSGIALIGLFPFTRPASAMGAVIRRVIVRAVAPVGEAIAGFARDLSDQLGARGRNLLWPEED